MVRNIYDGQEHLRWSGTFTMALGRLKGAHNTAWGNAPGIDLW
jgi:hypothetical protein